MTSSLGDKKKYSISSGKLHHFKFISKKLECSLYSAVYETKVSTILASQRNLLGLMDVTQTVSIPVVVEVYLSCCSFTLDEIDRALQVIDFVHQNREAWNDNPQVIPHIPMIFGIVDTIPAKVPSVTSIPNEFQKLTKETPIFGIVREPLHSLTSVAQDISRLPSDTSEVSSSVKMQSLFSIFHDIVTSCALDIGRAEAEGTDESTEASFVVVEGFSNKSRSHILSSLSKDPKAVLREPTDSDNIHPILQDVFGGGASAFKPQETSLFAGDVCLSDFAVRRLKRPAGSSPTGDIVLFDPMYDSIVFTKFGFDSSSDEFVYSQERRRKQFFEWQKEQKKTKGSEKEEEESDPGCDYKLSDLSLIVPKKECFNPITTFFTPYAPTETSPINSFLDVCVNDMRFSSCTMGVSNHEHVAEFMCGLLMSYVLLCASGKLEAFSESKIVKDVSSTSQKNKSKGAITKEMQRWKRLLESEQKRKIESIVKGVESKEEALGHPVSESEFNDLLHSQGLPSVLDIGDGKDRLLLYLKNLHKYSSHVSVNNSVSMVDIMLLNAIEVELKKSDKDANQETLFDSVRLCYTPLFTSVNGMFLLNVSRTLSQLVMGNRYGLGVMLHAMNVFGVTHSKHPECSIPSLSSVEIERQKQIDEKFIPMVAAMKKESLIFRAKRESMKAYWSGKDSQFFESVGSCPVSSSPESSKVSLSYEHEEKMRHYSDSAFPFIADILPPSDDLSKPHPKPLTDEEREFGKKLIDASATKPMTMLSEAVLALRTLDASVYEYAALNICNIFSRDPYGSLFKEAWAAGKGVIGEQLGMISTFMNISCLPPFVLPNSVWENVICAVYKWYLTVNDITAASVHRCVCMFAASLSSHAVMGLGLAYEEDDPVEFGHEDIATRTILENVEENVDGEARIVEKDILEKKDASNGYGFESLISPVIYRAEKQLQESLFPLSGIFFNIGSASLMRVVTTFCRSVKNTTYFTSSSSSSDADRADRYTHLLMALKCARPPSNVMHWELGIQLLTACMCYVRNLEGTNISFAEMVGEHVGGVMKHWRCWGDCREYIMSRTICVLLHNCNCLGDAQSKGLKLIRHKVFSIAGPLRIAAVMSRLSLLSYPAVGSVDQYTMNMRKLFFPGDKFEVFPAILSAKQCEILVSEGYLKKDEIPEKISLATATIPLLAAVYDGVLTWSDICVADGADSELFGLSTASDMGKIWNMAKIPIRKYTNNLEKKEKLAEEKAAKEEGEEKKEEEKEEEEKEEEEIILPPKHSYSPNVILGLKAMIILFRVQPVVTSKFFKPMSILKNIGVDYDIVKESLEPESFEMFCSVLRAANNIMLKLKIAKEKRYIANDYLCGYEAHCEAISSSKFLK
ncbi:hypothetical protein ADUPG1_000319 [Aduncisulcus paluster]|uniref:Uncharacterized protein n=1 Tax=Aduncisulcus paluster TaxID=2918883 RepID=A0ABQ5K913_9EUKA|nr:hypothetical protein ADUPG1_000319 [Aduncisulcus paluster]